MKRTPIRVLLVLATLLIAMLGPSITPVAAQDQPDSLATPDATPGPPPPPAFIIAPASGDGSYFDIEMEPGTSQELTVILGNGGEEPVVARAYAADAFTLVNGGFGIETEEDERDGTGSWIDFEPETLDLEPGDRVERTFTVSVPADAATGQHIAGIAIQTADSIAVGESSMLRQIIKKSIAVFITVPGPEDGSFEIGDISIQQPGGSSRIVVEINNTGNILVNPAGEIVVTDPSGATVVTAPIVMGPVYARDSTTLELSIPTELPEGDYTLDISLTDEYSGAEVAMQDVAVAVAPPAADAEEPDPITFDAVTLAPIPPDGEIQALNVQLTLNNTQASVPSGRLTMHVMKDGELVEDYPIGSSLALPTGETEIQQRYIPLAGWEPGEYTFAFTLEAVDPGTGQVTVLATHEAEETIEVP